MRPLRRAMLLDMEAQMKTYYEVVHSETGKPKLSQEQKRGTPAYGYATKAQAVRFCPAGYVVQERFQTASDDWAGAVVFTQEV